MPPTALEENRDLFDAGLIDRNSSLTKTGDRLLSAIGHFRQDEDEMLDFYLKGWIDADLNLTEDGIIWEGIQARGLQDILDETDRARGVQMYRRAEQNGALDWWKKEVGEDYETTGEFVAHAFDNAPEMAGQLFGELLKVPPGIAKAFDVATRNMPWWVPGVGPHAFARRLYKGKLTKEEKALVKEQEEARKAAKK